MKCACGTVKCWPTLAYRVHFDSINISDWTDYKILLQRQIGPLCCFNVRPTSATLADIKPTFGECAVLAGKALTVNMLEVNCFQTPTVTQAYVSQHKALMREMVNYFLIDVAQVCRVYMTWELALNAAMGMITVDVGWCVIVECPGATVAFWGPHCPAYFDSWLHF